MVLMIQVMNPEPFDSYMADVHGMPEAEAPFLSRCNCRLSFRHVNSRHHTGININFKMGFRRFRLKQLGSRCFIPTYLVAQGPAEISACGLQSHAEQLQRTQARPVTPKAADG